MDQGQAIAMQTFTGAARPLRHTASHEAFADWARYEVCLNENSWQRIDTTPCLIATDNAA